ncbi:NAD(P)H-hydrate dehydratase [Haloprofundus salinisoli]|uniref:NAD(P)H-hydrate dehydratase n=1 Tax=Haloprofundus salinisoli TaxID=2876193 RepID=UPI001CCF1303|nr:NAD(P)H-hydrate dehydratase [Haloprofundus salinisoli]
MDELLQRLTEGSGADKGENGRVGVIAGSIDFTNQPALVGEAALRTGSDVVRALTPEEIFPIVAGHSKNLLVSRYASDRFSEMSLDAAQTLADWSDALVIGPGLYDPDPETVQRLVSDADVPVVVDADAIRPATDADLDGTIFTPDTDETDRIEDQYGSLDEFATETSATVVLTGETDEVFAEGVHWTNETGTPAMTVAGTGDVLCGIVGSLLGRGFDRVEAAKLGTWLVGQAGELADEEYGDGLLATDIIERIPAAMN